MRLSYKFGFTIIETMLFLAITGVLVVGVMVGTGVAINRQRYSDSVTSFHALIQKQYSDVSNVNNGRDSGWVCDSVLANISKVELNNGIPRGQSDCVLLGKLITPSLDGESVLISDVVGSDNLETDLTDNYIEALEKYNIKLSPVIRESASIEWGSSLISQDGSPAVFSLLIVQSPTSGTIRTFVGLNKIVDNNSIKSIINRDALKESLKICIDSRGLFTGKRSAIYIKPGASSAAGVETLGEQSGC